jgi:hypothetical protein
MATLDRLIPFKAWKQTHSILTTNISWLIMFAETVAVYCENRTEHMYSVFEQLVCVVTTALEGVKSLCIHCQFVHSLILNNQRCLADIYGLQSSLRCVLLSL